MKNVLCFGDSNTYGYNPVFHDRYNFDIRWTGILSQRLKDTTIHITEEGLCGRTTVFSDDIRPHRNASLILPLLLETHSPIDTVIIMLGTNDCKTKYHATPQLIAKGMETLINQIKSFNSRINILIISPILLADGVWEKGFDEEFGEESIAISKKLKSLYKNLSQKCNCKFLAAEDYASPSTADREHMTPNGHAALANAIFDVLTDK